jgi:hypothetical protein
MLLDSRTDLYREVRRKPDFDTRSGAIVDELTEQLLCTSELEPHRVPQRQVVLKRSLKGGHGLTGPDAMVGHGLASWRSPSRSTLA